ncbi:FadR/GntR family transcriptional regulator [Mycobacterium sp. WUMAC-067]|uniref:FadR/GntR family transcriptional regulator n=1 Tax=Mycobacterium sp. WUMAC-067 TaxID=2798585 RepID=UPI001CDA45C5|nr:FCD domain-containing protein [Mycobacterium sp. WUMAC-067]
MGREVAKRTAAAAQKPAENPPPGKPKQIADQLRGVIITGGLDEGDLLGTEADLLDQFDVSRPSLREALRILEADGLISVARGVLGGVVVHRPDQRMTARAAALVLQARSVSLSDVFDASAVIEPAAARMLATSRGRQRAAELLRQVIVEQKRTVDDPLGWANAVVRFHSQIVHLAGNQTLILMAETINEVVDRAIADVLTRGQEQPATARRRTTRAHELLVELIADGDADAAQAHWATHMARLRRTLLGEFATTFVNHNRHV